MSAAHHARSLTTNGPLALNICCTIRALHLTQPPGSYTANLANSRWKWYLR
jgi:hypothetical protein